MGVTFNKPHGLKYTDMCIYIDENFKYTLHANEYPQIEERIYEYLYHIVYALSCKKCFFKNFADYDSFSLYAANELFMSMRNKLVNAGQDRHGKTIIPVKSCLNFIKATLFPLKVNYQKETFSTVLDPVLHDGVDSLGDTIKSDIQNTYKKDFLEAYVDACVLAPVFIKRAIQTTPFRRDKLMCKKLYISVILTWINDMTLPNNVKKKLDNRTESTEKKKVSKASKLYYSNQNVPTLWHIDEPIENYVKLIICKVKQQFVEELQSYIHINDLSENILDEIMMSAYESYDDIGEV